jgi:rod shape-determining protein MreB
MFKRTLYVQIRENRIDVRNVGESRTVQAVAQTPFSHPRMLVGDFTAAQACLKALADRARGAGLALKTEMLVHPMDKLEGGLTQIEDRVFRELAAGAGASKAVVWAGAPLSDAEVNAKLKGG